jgi:hypothetical protein
MEQIRNDIVMVVRFNALVPADAQGLLVAHSGPVQLPPLDCPL